MFERADKTNGIIFQWKVSNRVKDMNFTAWLY